MKLVWVLILMKSERMWPANLMFWLLTSPFSVSMSQLYVLFVYVLVILDNSF